MRMIMTAPGEVGGVRREIGDEVDVENAGEVNRLTFYGQAVPAEEQGTGLVTVDPPNPLPPSIKPQTDSKEK